MLYHALTSPVADITGTVTVFNSAGATTTEAASNIVRPSDWNSAHVEVMNFAGNTAGTSQISGTNLYFAGGNNVTLSANGQTVSIVAAAGGVGGVAVSAGTNSTATGTVAFANSNGISFGMDTNGQVTGTVRTDYQSAGAYLTTAQPVGAYLTTAALSNHSHNFATTTTNGSQIVVGTTNSAGATIGVPAFLTTAQAPGAYLTTAAQSNHSHNFATTTTNGSQIVVGTTNSAGATIGVPPFLTTAQAPGAYLTTARASNDGIGLNTALTGNGVAWTVNSSGLSLNVPAFLTTAAQVSHSHGNPTLNLTNLTGTTASASNGLTLSLSGNAAQTTQTQPAGNIAGVGTTFGGTNVSASMTLNSNGLALSLSAPTPGGGGAINVSAGTTSGNLQTIQFNNANGVSWGLNGSTVTASVNAGGGAGTVSTLCWPDYMATSTSQAIGTVGATTASGQYFPVSLSAPVAFNVLQVAMYFSHITSSVSGRQSATLQYGIFSKNAGTLASISTGSLSYCITNSSASATLSYPNATATTGYGYGTTSASATTQIQALWGTPNQRLMGFQFGNSMTLNSGIYWVGIHHAGSTSSAAVGLNPALAVNPGFIPIPMGLAATAVTASTDFRVPFEGLGAYTVTSSGLPLSVPVTQINHNLGRPAVTFIST